MPFSVRVHRISVPPYRIFNSFCLSAPTCCAGESSRWAHHATLADRLTCPRVWWSSPQTPRGHRQELGRSAESAERRRRIIAQRSVFCGAILWARQWVHSSICSSRIAPTRRMMVGEETSLQPRAHPEQRWQEPAQSGPKTVGSSVETLPVK